MAFSESKFSRVPHPPTLIDEILNYATVKVLGWICACLKLHCAIKITKTRGLNEVMKITSRFLQIWHIIHDFCMIFHRILKHNLNDSFHSRDFHFKSLFILLFTSLFTILFA